MENSRGRVNKIEEKTDFQRGHFKKSIFSTKERECIIFF